MVVHSVLSRLANYQRHQQENEKFRQESEKDSVFSDMVKEFSGVTMDEREAMRRLAQLHRPAELGLNFVKDDRRTRNRSELSPLALEKQQAYLRTVDFTNTSMKQGVLVEEF